MVGATIQHMYTPHTDKMTLCQILSVGGLSLDFPERIKMGNVHGIKYFS